MASARGTRPGCRARQLQSAPVLAHVGCGDSVMALSRCPYSRENARGVKRPFDRVPEPGAPLPRPRGGPPGGPWPPRISPASTRRASTRTSRTDPSLTGDADARWARVDPTHPRENGRHEGADAARAPGPVRQRLERPRQWTGRRPHQLGRIDPGPHREALGPARRQGPVARARPRRTRPAARPRPPRRRRRRRAPARPGTRQLEDPVLEPAVGPDQLGQLVDAPPRRGGARCSLSHPPTPRGPRSGSGW